MSGDMTVEVERQILDRLTTIEVMLRGALESRDDHENRLRELEKDRVTTDRVTTIENRIRSVEAWKFRVTGIGATIGAIVGAAATVAGRALSGG